LDALFADYACTTEGWPEAQAARQVLASLNMQLYRRRRTGESARLRHGPAATPPPARAVPARLLCAGDRA
ncbi:hypothetical protein ACV338_30590, partial [Pseudomonas aeruginosa]